MDGKSSIDIMKKRQPDLVLLDLMMPGFSGEDVLHTMKRHKKLKTIPVLLLTARASFEDRVYGLGLGADDYLSKPIYSEEVLLRVRNSLSRVALTKESTKRLMAESTLAKIQEVMGSTQFNALKLDNVELDFVWNQADLTGGDLLSSSYHPSTNRLYLFLGDVSGHGIKSALITLIIAGAIRSAISSLKDTNTLLSAEGSLRFISQATNAALFSTSEELKKMVTMNVACLDLKTGVFTLVNHGHNDVFLKSEKGVEPILIPGSPLGNSQELDMDFIERKLKAGEQLFFYTDGLIENRGPDGKFLKWRKLKRMVNSSDNPAETKKIILEECRQIWRNSPPQDDYTFLVLKWNGPPK